MEAPQEPCHKQGVDSSFPTQPQHIARFVAHLSLLGKAASTAKTYLAGISAFHKLNDWPDPTSAFLIKTLIRGMSRASVSVDTRLPITLQRLQGLLGILPVVCSSTYESCLFKAAFALAFHGFLRLSEILGQNLPQGTGRKPLMRNNLSFNLSSVTVQLSGSKTNQSGRKELILVRKESSMPDTCAVTALHQYMSAHPKCSDVLFVHINGAPLTQYQFRAVLKKAAYHLGWPMKGFSSHSFRIGAATSAAALGVPLDTIMELGRWKSAAVLGYIRPSWS